MARRRKTKAERDQERASAERRIWEQFRLRLEAVTSFAEAQSLADEAPPSTSPGRQYYSNLGFFLMSSIVTSGSSFAEKELYLQFIKRLHAAGALKPRIGEKIMEDLRGAMKSQGGM